MAAHPLSGTRRPPPERNREISTFALLSLLERATDVLSPSLSVVYQDLKKSHFVNVGSEAAPDLRLVDFERVDSIPDFDRSCRLLHSIAHLVVSISKGSSHNFNVSAQLPRLAARARQLLRSFFTG